jgi:hypothetical protein
VLDIDAADVPLHGRQELAEFHADHDPHCDTCRRMCSAASACWRACCGAAAATARSSWAVATPWPRIAATAAFHDGSKLAGRR